MISRSISVVDKHFSNYDVIKQFYLYEILSHGLLTGAFRSSEQ